MAKDDSKKDVIPERRAALKRLGRFAAVSGPAVTLLLAAGTKPAKADCTPSTCPP
jgi:hypothetical protein